MEEELGFLDHLEEMRMRILRVLAIAFILSIVIYPLSDYILIQAKKDLLTQYADDVIVTKPMEAVVVKLKLSGMLGLLISAPYAVYQFLVFMAPGLYPKEKKWLFFTLLSSIFLFILGSGFTYSLLAPKMIGFLLMMSEPVAKPMLQLDEIFSFAFFLIFWMGVIFQWPIVSAFLSNTGIVSYKSFSEFRRHAILICFILAAFITDPTVITQVIMALPMVIIYEIGIWTAWFFRRR